MRTLIFLLVLVVPLCACSNEHQEYLDRETTNNDEYQSFEFRTGQSSRTAFLNLVSVKEDAKPIVATRVFFLMKNHFAQTGYEAFELQYRGEPRVLFVRNELDKLPDIFVAEKPIPVIIEMLAIARTPNDRELAFTAAGGGLLGMMTAFTQNFSDFNDTWFLEDVKEALATARRETEVDLGDDL